MALGIVLEIKDFLRSPFKLYLCMCMRVLKTNFTGVKTPAAWLHAYTPTFHLLTGNLLGSYCCQKSSG